jgi:hypothetical protein
MAMLWPAQRESQMRVWLVEKSAADRGTKSAPSGFIIKDTLRAN